ncbi:hypothetical protein BH11BAC7_BH11BAC7_11540 [soil metagenome]
MESNGGRFKHFEYEIVTSEVEGDGVKINDEIRTLLEGAFHKIQRKKNSVGKELHEFVGKYPKVPQFKNLLFVYYAQQGNMTKAHEVNELILKEHPNYLFGKLNLVGRYLHDREYERIPGIMGASMEIKELFPDRNVFHLNEVVSFYRMAILYFLRIGNIDAAESRLNVISELPKDLLIDVEELSAQIMDARFKFNVDRFKREKSRRTKITITKNVVEPSALAPVFYHSEIVELYANDLRIDHYILRKILAFPKETVLPDLHKVVYDSIARFEVFAGEGDMLTEFPLHALLLMAEIGDASSLPVLLDVLRQDEKYIDFYFGDHITETFWEIVLKLGVNNTDVLGAFIREGNYYEFSRSAVTSAITQLGHSFPERKNEVLQWFREILEFFLKNKDNDSLVDTGLISSMVSSIIEMRAVVLQPLIEELYRNELVLESYTGTLESVIIDLSSPEQNPYTNRVLLPVLDRYSQILSTWASYTEKQSDDLDDEYWDEDFDDVESDFLPDNPVVRSEPKTGRNDPCPCGSGMKYKKCHGK